MYNIWKNDFFIIRLERAIGIVIPPQYTDELDELNFEVIMTRRPERWPWSRTIKVQPRSQQIQIPHKNSRTQNPIVWGRYRPIKPLPNLLISCILALLHSITLLPMLFGWFHATPYQSPQIPESTALFFYNFIIWTLKQANIVQTTMELRS